MSDDLKKLSGKIHALNETSPYNMIGKADIAKAAMNDMLKILNDFEG